MSSVGFWTPFRFGVTVKGVSMRAHENSVGVFSVSTDVPTRSFLKNLGGLALLKVCTLHGL